MARPSSKSRDEKISLKISVFGPSTAAVEELRERLKTHPAVLKCLGKARHRLLWLTLVDPVEDPKPARPKAPERFQAVFYDYTANRSVFVEGSMRNPAKVAITDSSFQPRPSPEEFDDAVQLVHQHNELGILLRDGRFRPYPPMPP